MAAPPWFADSNRSIPCSTFGPDSGAAAQASSSSRLTPCHSRVLDATHGLQVAVGRPVLYDTLLSFSNVLYLTIFGARERRRDLMLAGEQCMLVGFILCHCSRCRPTQPERIVTFWFPALFIIHLHPPLVSLLRNLIACHQSDEKCGLFPFQANLTRMSGDDIAKLPS